MQPTCLTILTQQKVLEAGNIILVSEHYRIENAEL